MNAAYPFTPRNYRRLFHAVMDRGQCVIGTKEVVNAHLVLENPIDRLVTDRARMMIFPFGVAEWLSFMSGEQMLSFFTPYVKRYAEYSTDGVLVDGAYGPRLHEYDQWSMVLEMLAKDPTSRRAVLSIYRGGDLSGEGGKNTPCTLTMQFLIRNGALDAIVNMRSNDINWGLTYDVMVFTLAQEWVAMRLGVPLGTYYHNAGSLHVYERDWHLYDKLGLGTKWPRTMASMPLIEQDEFTNLYGAYKSVEEEWFWKFCKLLRTEYCANMALAARAFVTRSANKTEALECFSQITDDTIRFVMRPWMVKSGVINETQRVHTSPRPLRRESD